jgi:glycosyltransferase involved in cell wall biosynthesis
MRILYANNRYCSDVDGAAKSTQMLAEQMTKDGYSVGVFCVNNTNKVLSVLYLNGVKIYKGHGGLRDYNRVISGKLNFIEKWIFKLLTVYNPTIKREIEKVFEDFKPDILHTNSITGMSLIVWVLAKKHNIKVVHTQHDYSMLAPSEIVANDNFIPLYKKPFILLYQICCKRLSNHVDYLTSPSEYTLRKFDKYFKHAKGRKCVPNSIIYDKEVFQKNVQDRLNKKISYFTFLYVGRLKKYKGVKQLVQAFTNIHDESIRLVVCGSGELEEFILESVKKDSRIIYRGALDKDKLAVEYKNADVIVVPSMWEETFGLVIIEANYFCLPAIVSNKGGMPDIIENIGGGVIYKYDDIAALKQEMLNIKSSVNLKDFYNSIIKNISLYSLENQVKVYSDIYKELYEELECNN